MIHVFAEQYVSEDKKVKFIELANQLVAETVKEDGCIFYDILEDIADDLLFSFIEQWESKAHLYAHFETKHFKMLVPMLNEFTSVEGKVTFIGQQKKLNRKTIKLFGINLSNHQEVQSFHPFFHLSLLQF